MKSIRSQVKKYMRECIEAGDWTAPMTPGLFHRRNWPKPPATSSTGGTRTTTCRSFSLSLRQNLPSRGHQ